MELTDAQTALLDAVATSQKTVTVTAPGWRAYKTDPGWDEEHETVPPTLAARPVGLALVSVANLRLWGHLPETIAELEALGLLQRWAPANPEIVAILTVWAPPGGDSITFTPAGANRAGVVLQEHVELIRTTEPEHDPIDGRWVFVEHSEPHEVPEWAKVPKRRPLRLPRYGREYHMPWPERVADKSSVKQYLKDVETGELTTDVNKAARLFPSHAAPITIDPKLKGKGGSKKKSRKRQRRSA